MTLIITLSLVGVILVATTLSTLVMQQRRLIRNRSTLASRLLATQDSERAAVARDLHDDVVGHLDSIARQLGVCDDVTARLLGKETAVLSQGLRDLARRLHPRIVELQGLVVALEGLVVERQGHAGITITFTETGAPHLLPAPIALALFRVVQEALRNAIRYSGAENIVIALGRTDRATTLSVEDDGAGFASGQGAGSSGIGLLSMRERVQSCGGTLVLHSVLGVGTTISVTVPHRAEA